MHCKFQFRVPLLLKVLRTIFLLPWLVAMFVLPAHAAPLDPELVAQLNADGNAAKKAAIIKLTLLATPESILVLKSLANNELFLGGENEEFILLMKGEQAFDAATGEEITPVPEYMDSLYPNNRVRRMLNTSLEVLELSAPDRKERLAAAKKIEDSGADPAFLPVLDSVLKKETDSEIKHIVTMIRAMIGLNSKDPAVRLTAVKDLGESDNPDLQLKLTEMTDPANEADSEVRAEAKKSLDSLNQRLIIGESITRVFTGLSLGSILLLAAMGLAITYGVMGIINMAHGELLMIGAFATFVVHDIFRDHYPEYFDWYIVVAVPVAFFTAAIVGAIMERTVIRWLYGRALETLLTTWGISLILIQTVRSTFGTFNQEIANPSWLSGSVVVMSNVDLPWNRIVIIGFAVLVLALMWVLLNRTRLGLFVRAVTQNRAMAGCVGVPTARIDTVAFALGAAIAGLGGVSLSQVGNVGPEMGQGWIVDCFMTVVLGGVGQLAGTVWAAMGIGVVTKLVEGGLGAVIAKVVVLVIIIMVIQKRPQGIFALKGRVADD
ncbi:MAG: urea ABC transporter permease subunit UrtB [Nitrosomonadaceae bacterium]|nr:urea ABC transporter permease subunit UrtB [Nitrosomonadaceae bacterium]